MNTIETIQNTLVDEESKVYFQARMSYISNPSLSQFYRLIRENKVKYRIRDIENYQEHHHAVGWIVWGTNDTACYNYLLLKDTELNVAGCCSYYDEISKDAANSFPVLSFNETLKLVLDGYSILVSDPLEKMNPIVRKIPEESVLYVQDHLVGRCGWQYFDYFSPAGTESFIDGGSLDGKTTLDFIKWCKGDYSKIFAIDPNPLVRDACEQSLQQVSIEKIHFFEAALWREECTMKFDVGTDARCDAALSPYGQVSVQCISIDQMVGLNDITFIKLDVEGAELPALQGAQKCINRCKPRMAVSIYHSPHAFIDIMKYLHGLVPEYHFSIRHYHSDCIETILYVFT